MHLPAFLTPYADPYTNQWMSSSPLLPVSFLLAYWTFHWIYVPEYHQPIEYRQYWQLYKNIVIVLINLWQSVVIANTAQALNYDWYCEPVDPDPKRKWGLNAEEVKLTQFMKDQSFYFLLIKMVECSDTVVMSLRGGLYPRWVFRHHSAMILVVWVTLTFVPAGTSSIVYLVSSIGHVLDYLFLILRRYPGGFFEGKNYLLEWFNLGQLGVVVVLAVSSFYQGCGYPVPASVSLFLFGVLLIIEQLLR